MCVFGCAHALFSHIALEDTDTISKAEAIVSKTTDTIEDWSSKGETVITTIVRKVLTAGFVQTDCGSRRQIQTVSHLMNHFL